MSSILQTLTGDLDISTGNLTVVRDVNAITAQKLTNRFQFFLGEWFLDTRQGVPYFQNIFVKNPDMGIVAQIFNDVILSTPGVADIRSGSFDYRNDTRSLTATFNVQTNTGAVLVGGTGSPFVITLNSEGTIT